MTKPKTLRYMDITMLLWELDQVRLKEHHGEIPNKIELVTNWYNALEENYED